MSFAIFHLDGGHRYYAGKSERKPTRGLFWSTDDIRHNEGTLSSATTIQQEKISNMKRGTIIRETLTLQRDLLNGLKISELDRWAGNSEVRLLLLQHLMFGRIRWLKSNGKPVSPTLSQGFTILYWNLVIEIAESQGGPIESSSWAPLPEPFKFDEPDDSDHYSVGFFAYQSFNSLLQHIQPTFASGVAWPNVLDRYRSIEPPDWYGQESETNHLIPDFTVSLQWL